MATYKVHQQVVHKVAVWLETIVETGKQPESN